MRKLPYIITSFLFSVAFFGCTDVIDLDANFEEAELVVDAWLNQQSNTQTIYLTLTQSYYDASFAPGVSDAVVQLTNDSKGLTYAFEHKGNGAYEWTPLAGVNLGDPGDEFTLSVSYKDWSYFASTQMEAAPPVDSIVTEFRESELGSADGIYAQFYARDLPGEGNTYWIKTFKNGTFLNKPSEMNISADGTFDLGSGTDGIVFIPPIREAINRIPDPDTADDSDVPPYAVGDEIRVEIHGISNAAHRFLSIAQEQMTNGDAGLFASPVANSPTNIVPLENDAPAALGFFNVGMISSLEIEVQ